MGSNLLGSAGFCKENGVPTNEAFNGFNIVFGAQSHEPDIRWYVRRPHKHFVSVAPTRSGKGAALIIPNLLFYQGSAIVIDPKGENAYITAPRRRELGQKTIILDPWNEVNRRYGDKTGEFEQIATYNPLSVLDPKSPHFLDDLAYIADALIINQGKDPHWDNAARELMAGLIAFAVYEEGAAASLALVRHYITMPQTHLAGLAEKAQEWGAENVAARKLASFVNPDSKENSSIISTAKTQTAFLDSAALSENMLESSFSFSDLVEGQATLYLVLPVDKLYTYGRWLRLMVSLGIRTISRNTKALPAPVLFVLDEFGTIGKLAAVSQAVGLMAGLQMCVWVFVQDLIQLKRDYPDEWETFLGNASDITFSDVMDQFTCEYCSKMLGKTTVERISVGTAERRKGGFLSTGDPNYSQMSDQNFSRELLTPDEVRRQPEYIGIIISRELPKIYGKCFYYHNSFFCDISRLNPYYPDPKEANKATEQRAEEEQKEEENKKSMFARRWV
jgi:type IV secretion system protein VirD4